MTGSIPISSPAVANTVVHGTGPHHVIMLNGWFGRAQNWGPFAQHLDLELFTWHFFDYRGYGARQQEAGEFTLAEISQEVSHYIDNLGVDQISLLGHSMGAVFMQRVLLDTPIVVRALVGISPVPASGTLFDEETRALFDSAATEEGSRRAIIDFTTGGRLPDAWLDHAAAESIAHSTPQAVGNYLLAWADCDFADELGTQDLPVLLLTGQRDPAVTVAGITDTYGKIYSQMQLRELPDTGHYALFEHPLDMAAQVMNFLKEV